VSATWAESHADLIGKGTAFARDRETVGPGHVQRALRVGFATACLLLEALEERGIVGPANGNGRRSVLAAYAPGDRVLISASYHPWHGHTGTISGPFSTPNDPDLKWTVALDDGWSTAAVAENDIRRVQ